MKTVDLDFDYTDLHLGKLSEEEVLPFIFGQLVSSAYPEGLGVQDNILLFKVMSKMDSLNGNKEVDFEDAEYDWAKSVVANGKFHTSQNKFAYQLYQKFGIVE